MTISFENTLEDAIDWNRVRLTKTMAGRKAQKRLRVVLSCCQGVFGIGIYLILCGLLSAAPEFWRGFLIFSLVAAFGYGVQFLQFPQIVKRQAKKLFKNGFFAQFLGPKEVTASPEGLRISWAEGEFLRRWPSQMRIEENETHLMLIFGESDFSTIPKRAFRDAAHQQEFLGAVERFRAGAGAMGASTGTSLAPSSSNPWWRNRSAVDANEEKSVQQRRL